MKQNGGAARPAASVLTAFASTGIVTYGLSIPLSLFLPQFYVSEMGLGLAAVGIVFMIIRLIDVGFDPLMGVVMDRTNIAGGRFKVWLAASVPVLLLAIAMVCFPPAKVGALYLAGWLLVLYVGYSIWTLAQAAWGSVLSPDYHERTRVYSYLTISFVVGSLIVAGLPGVAARVWPGDMRAGMHTIGWSMIVAIPLTALLALLTVPEPVSANETQTARPGWRGYGSVLFRDSTLRVLIADFAIGLAQGMTATTLIFFFHARQYSAGATTLLVLATILAGAAGPMWIPVARKWSKHRAFAIGMLLNCASLVVMVVLPPAAFWPALIVMILSNAFNASGVVLLPAMVADVSDEIWLDVGSDIRGLLYAIFSSTRKIAAALSVSFSFGLLSWAGFDPKPGAQNSVSAIHGLEACFIGIPMFLILLSVAALWKYKLDSRRHREILAKLNAIKQSPTLNRTSMEDLVAAEPLA